MSTLLARTKQTKRVVKRRDADPWRRKLENIKGVIGDDGIERIASQTVGDILELKRNAQSPRQRAKIARLMGDLGWRKCKTRGLNRGAYRSVLNGYAREATA